MRESRGELMARGMNAEQRYQVFQIKPGKPMPLFIDPDDPKGIKDIQKILEKLDKEKEE